MQDTLTPLLRVLLRNETWSRSYRRPTQAGRRYVFTSAHRSATAPAEVADEEPSRTVALVVGHRIVPARVGVQRLLLRAEGIEQRYPRRAVVILVVPRDPVLDRDRELSCRFDEGVVHKNSPEAHGSDPGFDRGQHEPGHDP